MRPFPPEKANATAPLTKNRPPVLSFHNVHMCRQLNNRCREGAFPLGTFMANVLGSLVMALVFYGTRNSSSLTTGWSNVAIKAFQVGFGGLLCYQFPTTKQTTPVVVSGGNAIAFSAVFFKQSCYSLLQAWYQCRRLAG